jgi:hypothetical protein
VVLGGAGGALHHERGVAADRGGQQFGQPALAGARVADQQQPPVGGEGDDGPLDEAAVAVPLLLDVDAAACAEGEPDRCAWLAIGFFPGVGKAGKALKYGDDVADVARVGGKENRLAEGHTSSPALRGDPYHPDVVDARSAYNRSLYGPGPADRARDFGFSRKEKFRSHGAPVFSNKNRTFYISPDVDEHNVTLGWKMFDRNMNRIGTSPFRGGV